MAFADTADANKFLDETKIVLIEHTDDDEPEQDSAERIIRGYLAGHIAASEIATWTTPGSTPELIRDIAGRLVAAFRYRKLYSEDVNEVSPYAQALYDEAIRMLNMIVDGSLTIVSLVDDELVDLERGAGLSNDHFYPTDTQKDERKFGMDLIF